MSQENLFQDFFHQVQLSGIFVDSKTFADAIPKSDLDIILQDYSENQSSHDFDLKDFVERNFITRESSSSTKDYKSNDIRSHIETMWQVLKRSPNMKKDGSSRIHLAHPYIVPGGRFDEIYYWDSYFTFLGLIVSKKLDMINSMLENFKDLINQYGHIPNGNRTYFLTRSQPPFFAAMISLVANRLNSDERNNFLLKNLSALEYEYSFWMKGQESLIESPSDMRRIVQITDQVIMNRYYDEEDTPRPESYKEDFELKEKTKRTNILRNIRAACESGWDFSSRWFGDDGLATIKTTDIVPIDLNCLLYHAERTLSEIYTLKGDNKSSEKYQTLAEKRKTVIQDIFWDDKRRCFYDYDWKKEEKRNNLTTAIAFPLYFKVATEAQASHIKDIIESKLLRNGGVVTTTIRSGQQWDEPNGWAPLQWIAIIGLQNYGYDDLAKEIAIRWSALCERTFEETGQLMEKYNVCDLDVKAGGGEYPVQEGFGWSNGVYLALQDEWYKTFEV